MGNCVVPRTTAQQRASSREFGVSVLVAESLEWMCWGGRAGRHGNEHTQSSSNTLPPLKKVEHHLFQYINILLEYIQLTVILL